MKRFIYTIVISLLLTSCFEDQGNYDYQDKEVITVEGLEGKYVLVSLTDTLRITPTITASDEAAEFEYFWGIYGKQTPTMLDTIAKTKDVDYRVVQNSGSWNLVFGVTNKITGFTQHFKSVLEVTTMYTRGWYLLKDDGEYADLDQYITEDTIVPVELVPDILGAKGDKVLGKGMMLNYFTDYYSYYTDSTATSATKTKTFVVVTDKDVSFNYIGDMGRMKSLDDLTYIPVTTEAPLFASFSDGLFSFFVNNGGKIHSCSSMIRNSGTFSAEALRNDAGDDYSISKYHLNGGRSGNKNLFYDEMSTSFLYYNSSGYKFIECKANSNSIMPVQNTNKELLYMGIIKDQSSSPAIAYMKDKTNGNLRILAKITGSYTSLLIKTDTITPDQKIFDATHLTLSQDEELIYFVSADGTEVWSRNLSNSVEQMQFQAPAGETITMLRQRKYAVSGEQPFWYNYVMVGTATDAKEYKVYFFSKSAGNFSAEPNFVMEGNGIPRDIIYMSPKVGYTTYVQGY